MQKQESQSKDLLHDWIDQETLPLDVVASWESLCDTYDMLRFKDELTDSMRLEEFKWIIQQMNCFLTRIRKSLMTTKDHDAAIMVLRDNLVPNGKTSLENRKSLAYQKLRQRWVIQAITVIQQMQQEQTMEQKENLNGWTSYGID